MIYSQLGRVFWGFTALLIRFELKATSFIQPQVDSELMLVKYIHLSSSDYIMCVCYLNIQILT